MNTPTLGFGASSRDTYGRGSSKSTTEPPSFLVSFLPFSLPFPSFFLSFLSLSFLFLSPLLSASSFFFQGGQAGVVV